MTGRINDLDEAVLVAERIEVDMDGAHEVVVCIQQLDAVVAGQEVMRASTIDRRSEMEGAPLELAEGHVHTAWDGAFTSICEVWPTPRAGFWHVWLRGPQSNATTEPLPSDLVQELLEEWGFSAQQWRNCRVKPQPTNPGLRPEPVISPPAGPTPKHSYGR